MSSRSWPSSAAALLRASCSWAWYCFMSASFPAARALATDLARRPAASIWASRDASACLISTRSWRLVNSASGFLSWTYSSGPHSQCGQRGGLRQSDDLDRGRVDLDEAGFVDAADGQRRDEERRDEADRGPPA